MKSPGGSVDSAYKSGLPDFTHPPLVEVAVGLMFEPLSINTITLAQLYSQWQEDYPSVEEHSTIPSLPPVPGLIEIDTPRIRFWLLNNSGWLIQVQRDRLVVNWRKEEGSTAYPRYGSLRIELEQRVTQLSEFIARQNQEELKPTTIEVTYVNQVPLASKSSNLSDIVSLLQPTPRNLGSLVETNIFTRFDASVELGRESAALIINAQLINAQRSSTVDPPLAVLQLSCSTPAHDLSDAFDALDRARAHVVRSFQSVTTDKMHEEWGIRR